MKKSMLWLIAGIIALLIVIPMIFKKKAPYRRRRRSNVAPRRSVSRGAKKFLKRTRKNAPGTKKKWYYFKGRKTTSARTWGKWMKDARKKR